MNPIPFHKMSGSGNDFILINNRQAVLPDIDPRDFARRVCRRKVSAGADGLILIENSDVADFKWRFFNSDGSIAEMCGNGARCVARFAVLRDICGPGLRDSGGDRSCPGGEPSGQGDHAETVGS
jgi:diaminopimelate epimerase